MERGRGGLGGGGGLRGGQGKETVAKWEDHDTVRGSVQDKTEWFRRWTWKWYSRNSPLRVIGLPLGYPQSKLIITDVYFRCAKY